MSERGKSEIRADVRAMRADGSLGPKVGEVIVSEQPDGARLLILSGEGDGERIVFSAPLGVLAWQLALMEPHLAPYLTQR
jgi:hypothetical protein